MTDEAQTPHSELQTEPAEQLVSTAESPTESATEPAEGLVGKVVETARNVSEKVGDVVEDVAEKVGDVVEDVKDRVADVVEEVKERVGLAPDNDQDDTHSVAHEQPENDAQSSGALSNLASAGSQALSSAREAVSDLGSDQPASADTQADQAQAEPAHGILSNLASVAGQAFTSARETASDLIAKGKETLGLGDAAEQPEQAEQPVAESDSPQSDQSGADQSAEASATPAGAEAGAVFVPTAEGERSYNLADLEPGMELQGRVTSTALYGIFVDVGVGRDGLVHISEMSDRRIDSPSDLVQIGDSVVVRVKSVDPEARRISLTMRSPRVEQPGDASKRRSRGPRRQEVNLEKLGTIQVGDLIEGVVNGIAPFGVFVDIGVGKDGLVHISELAEGRVDRAEDAVTVGESYSFRVLEVDPEGQRISLSLRRAQEGYQDRPRGAPTGGSSSGGGGGRRREANLDGIEPGAILDGTVNGIAPFGAFIDLGVGRDGLVHISELSEGRIGKVEDVVQVGQKVQVRVIEVDPSSKRISLSLRLTPPIGPVSTSGSSRLDRDWTNPAQRDDRGARPERSGGGGGGASRGGAGGGPRRGGENRPPREPEVFTFGEDEEEQVFEGGNATLDDLLSKFGSEDTRRPSKKRLEREDYDEERENRDQRARRDAIRRTLSDTEEE